jgi:hypothetical protein
MAKARLSPLDETGVRLSIRFLFAEEPIRGFREMPSHGADGLGMALASGDALLEVTDVDPVLEAAHLTVQTLDLLEELPGGIEARRRQCLYLPISDCAAACLFASASPRRM